jgi:uncharacterized membrane protein YhaH (DUF805 family)
MFTGAPLLDFVIGMSLILSYFFCKHVGEGLTGRIGRKRYVIRQLVIWLAWILLIPLVVLPSLALFKANPSVGATGMLIILPVLLIPGSLFILWFTITTDVKRLHDMNRGGGWYIIIYGLMLLGAGLDVMMLQRGVHLNLAAVSVFVISRLVLILVPGSKGNNQYGYNHDKNYLF